MAEILFQSYKRLLAFFPEKNSLKNVHPSKNLLTLSTDPKFLLLLMVNREKKSRHTLKFLFYVLENIVSLFQQSNFPKNIDLMTGEVSLQNNLLTHRLLDRRLLNF